MDFSIIEFCISLPSVVEASEYLSQYLMTLPGMTQQQMQAFKGEFVRRKEQISSNGVVSTSDLDDSDALFANGGKRAERTKSAGKDMARLVKDEAPADIENSLNSAGGKKKGKKGKKVVDPSLLGFSVTSNRIMMGEIQHIED